MTLRIAMHAGTWLRDRVQRPTPLAILAVGWLGLVLYANPGYLSAESIQALADARAGHYHDLSAVIWRITDLVIPGPFGMLLVQATCFLAGAYLVLRSCLSPRRAAACAIAVLWFPAVSGTLGVIWPEPHAAGWLLLGTGALRSTRRRARIAGLVALVLGAAMTLGGVVVILPLVVGLFRWSPADRRARRVAFAGAAWLLASLLAIGLGARFTDPGADDRARVDLAGTLYHGGSATDAALAPAFASPPASGLAAVARAAYDPRRSLAELRAEAARTFGAAPHPALVRARDAVVSADRAAYLAYRWEVFRQLIQLTHPPAEPQVYRWFTDVRDLSGSAGVIEHGARVSGVQVVLQRCMAWLGTTWLFEPYVYLLLALALVAMALRDRVARALLGSGIAVELVALVRGMDAHFRSALWLAACALLAAVIVATRRARAARSHGPDAELA